MPATVSHIGYKAFYNCKMLSDVNLPEGLTEVDEQALAECPATSPGFAVHSHQGEGLCLAGNTKLTGIQVADANPAFVAVDGVLFDKQMTKLIAYPSGKPGGEYHVPNGGGDGLSGRFLFAVNLVSVSLPDGVVNLGRMILPTAKSVGRLFSPYSITAIADGTFNLCQSGYHRFAQQHHVDWRRCVYWLYHLTSIVCRVALLLWVMMLSPGVIISV